MIIKQNSDVSDECPSIDGDIILVQNSDLKQEAILDTEIILHSNYNSSIQTEVVIQDRMFKDDANFRYDGESYDPFQNLVIDSECKYDDSIISTTYDCVECGSSLKSRSTLKRHIRMFHCDYNIAGKKGGTKSIYMPEPVNKMYNCPACNYSTRRRDKMDKHVQKHVADGYHPSGKKRNRPHQPLQRQRHNAEEYRCDHCPYSCTVEKALKKHLKLHFNSGKEFSLKMSCKICGKDRHNDAEMKKHMRKHVSGEKFLCDVCGFTSVQLKKIIQHRRMHTGERPHLCPFCSYRSARRDNLRSHVRRMHKKENMYIDTFNPTEVSDAVKVEEELVSS